jgi:hypothetical protein
LLDFSGVMTVVVDDEHTANLSFALKATPLLTSSNSGTVPRNIRFSPTAIAASEL